MSSCATPKTRSQWSWPSSHTEISTLTFHCSTASCLKTNHRLSFNAPSSEATANVVCTILPCSFYIYVLTVILFSSSPRAIPIPTCILLSLCCTLTCHCHTVNIGLDEHVSQSPIAFHRRMPLPHQPPRHADAIPRSPYRKNSAE